MSCWGFWTWASCHGSWWWLMLTHFVESCNAWSLDLCILVCREPSICFTLWDNSVTWALQISRFIMHSKYKDIFFHKQVNSIQKKAVLLLLHFLKCTWIFRGFVQNSWICFLRFFESGSYLYLCYLLSLREIKRYVEYRW